MIRRTALATTLAVAVASATACGGGTDASDQVKETLHAWFRDIAHGNGKSGCARLTTNARRQFAEQFGDPEAVDCDGAVAILNDELTPDVKTALTRVRVRRVDVRGDRAEIDDADVEFPRRLVRSREVNEHPTVFRRIDGRWLLEDLG
jgi:hypothetical protein